MKIEIEKLTKSQKDIIAKIESLLDENISPLQKEVVIKDFTDRGIIITNGTLYDNIIKELMEVPGFVIFFENGLIIENRYRYKQYACTECNIIWK